jgi:hypothetical protein
LGVIEKVKNPINIIVKTESGMLLDIVAPEIGTGDDISIDKMNELMKTPVGELKENATTFEDNGKFKIIPKKVGGRYRKRKSNRRKSKKSRKSKKKKSKTRRRRR